LQSLFAERIEEKRKLVKAAQAQARSGELGEALFGDLHGREDTEPSVSRYTPSFVEPDAILSTPGSRSGEIIIRQKSSAWRVLALLTGGALIAVVVLLIFLWPSKWGEKSSAVEPVPEKPDKPVVEDAGTKPDKKPDEAVVVVPPKETDPDPAQLKKKKKRKKRRKKKTIAKGGPGRLRLATTPWTTVYFKGEKLGVTPLVDVELPPGRHTLRVVNPGKGIDRKIKVLIRPGQTTAKSVRF
jgi:hypothetical protein